MKTSMGCLGRGLGRAVSDAKNPRVALFCHEMGASGKIKKKAAQHVVFSMVLNFLLENRAEKANGKEIVVKGREKSDSQRWGAAVREVKNDGSAKRCGKVAPETALFWAQKTLAVD